MVKRIAAITSTLQKKLEAAFQEGLRTGELNLLSRVLRTYAIIDKTRDAEMLFREVTVKRFMNEVMWLDHQTLKVFVLVRIVFQLLSSWIWGVAYLRVALSRKALKQMLISWENIFHLTFFFFLSYKEARSMFNYFQGYLENEGPLRPQNLEMKTLRFLYT